MPAGYNEADTRAKLIDPALHTARWIELVAEPQRTTHGEIHREQSAVRIEILDGKPFKRRRGRVDYLLRAYVGEHEQPLTLAFVEAKKEKLPPTQGLEQVKEYARRFAVKFVYSTNGHLFVEHDTHTGRTSEPRPLAQFPSPAELRERWFQATGLKAESPALTPLLTAYHASEDDGVKELFKKMLMSARSGVMPVMPSPLITERARDLRWNHGITCRPMGSTALGDRLADEVFSLLHDRRQARAAERDQDQRTRACYMSGECCFRFAARPVQAVAD